MLLDSVFFISCFLPILLLFYFLVPNIKWKNTVLLLFSLLFYSFGSLSDLALLLGSTFLNYLLGLLLQGQKGRKAILVVGVALNIAFLGVYKYLNFFVAEIFGVPEVTTNLVAPIGISFFTFKSISYFVDTYRDPRQGTRSLPGFLLFIAFFPQITMGPINRYKDFEPQLFQREHSGECVVTGLQRFVIGLSKKLLLAAPLGKMTDSIFALEFGVLDARLAWLGGIGYCLQLYFDFSGYIDMALGLSNVFGFTSMENFNYPYIAKTIGDFWHRWHISLSTWFKDYVYIPLGGNRKGKLRTGLNKAVVFLLCGVWHGANWTYLVWGAWHGLFSMLESYHVIPVKKMEKTKVWGHVYTLFVVCIGFVMFRAASVAQGAKFIAVMFTGFHITASGTVALRSILTAETIFALLLGVVFSLPVLPALKKQCVRLGEPVLFGVVVFLFALCILKLAAGNFAPGIYAGF